MTETDGCVKFGKNPWHKKAVDSVFPYFLSDGYKTSLCPYMRRVVIAVLALPFIIGWRGLPYRVQEYDWLVQAELIFFSLIVIGAFGLDVLDTMYPSEKISLPPFFDMVSIGFLGGNLIGIVGFVILFGIVALSDYIRERPKKEHRTAGLLKSYFHAKHNKICPCVEFEKDD